MISSMFIRFGKFSDCSTNHLTGDVEKGVSVYECLYDFNIKAYRIIFPKLTESACVSLSGFDKPDWYLVTGIVVGIGSDGEPLLSNIDIIKEKPNIYGMEDK